MLSAIWKFAALVGVIGVGCLVVLQAQRGMAPSRDGPLDPGSFSTLDDQDQQGSESPQPQLGAAESGELPPQQSEPDWTPEPTLAAPSVVPARTSTPGSIARSSAPSSREPEPTGAFDPFAAFDDGPGEPAGDVATRSSLPNGGLRTLPDDAALDLQSTPADVTAADAMPPAFAGEAGTDNPFGDRGGVQTIAGEGVPLGAGDPFETDRGATDERAMPADVGSEPFSLFDASPESSHDESTGAEADPFAASPSDAPPMTVADPESAGFGTADAPARTPTLPDDPFASDPGTNEADTTTSDPPALLAPPGRIDEPVTAVPVHRGDNAAADKPGSLFESEGTAAPLFEAQPSDEPPAPPASRVPAPETSVFEPEPDAGATTDVRPLFPEHLPEVRTVPRSNAPDMQIIPRDRRVEIPLRGTTAERGPKPEPDFSGDATLTSHVPAGPQQPELKIEKVAPPEAMVGEPLIYAIHVRNVGRSAAHDVIVEDPIPRGTTLTGTIPRAEMIDKRLIWKLGTIESGQQQTIRVRVTPTDAGEIGSVATVRFAAEVAAATIITATRLELDFSAPGEIAVGEQAAFRFRATNRGVTEARGVYVRSLLPDELQHPGGKDIEYEIGDLSPGETKEVTLSLSAVATGQAQGRAFLTINGKNQAEAAADITVIPSRLVVTRNGPEKRWVGRAADFTNTVANRTQRDVENVTVTETLPRGLELAGAPEGGKYDKQSRTVTWQIARLPAGQAQTLRLSVVPGEPGTLPSTVRATDSGGHTVEVSSQLEVIGFPALVVDVEHDGKPVAVGEQLALRLKVRNRGSAPAEKVQAVFELPPEMEFVDARGPGRFQREGRLVRFETFETLPAAVEQSFDIVLTAASAGETRVSAQLTSDGLSQPLRHDAPVVIVPADAGEVR